MKSYARPWQLMEGVYLELKSRQNGGPKAANTPTKRLLFNAWAISKTMGPFGYRLDYGTLYLGVLIRDLNFGKYPHVEGLGKFRLSV